MKRKSPATEERLEAVRAHLREHHAGIEPDAGFAARVASRLRRRSAGEAFAWAALRLLPASLAVLAALAWISLQLVETRADAVIAQLSAAEDSQTPLPSEDLVSWLLADESAP